MELSWLKIESFYQNQDKHGGSFLLDHHPVWFSCSIICANHTNSLTDAMLDHLYCSFVKQTNLAFSLLMAVSKVPEGFSHAILYRNWNSFRRLLVWRQNPLNLGSVHLQAGLSNRLVPYRYTVVWTSLKAQSRTILRPWTSCIMFAILARYVFDIDITIIRLWRSVIPYVCFQREWVDISLDSRLWKLELLASYQKYSPADGTIQITS